MHEALAAAGLPFIDVHDVLASAPACRREPCHLFGDGHWSGTGHRLLAASNQTPWRLESAKARRTLDVDSHVLTNSSEVVRELALAGVGIALRSTWDVGHELASGALRRILPDWQGARDVGITAVHARAEPLPAALRSWLAHLEALYAPAPPWER